MMETDKTTDDITSEEDTPQQEDTIQQDRDIPETTSDEEDAVSEYNDTASEYAALEEALSEANDKYLRLYAEYDNYRKRTAREKNETYQNASVKCISDLLPVIDSFERSLESECADENFRNGMNMIWGQLKEFLNKMNVTEIEALGKEFDPNIHNAISRQEGTDYDADRVCAVYQKGYMLGDKLIRPAMVAVAC